jgi:catechol 2,3-dioxygenase-like lactoylglutathione lyase family enzyme
MDRARAFYADKLGLEPVEERPGGLLYRCASGEFAVFESAGVSGTFTPVAFPVEALVTTVAELRSRGVVFEQVNVPGLTPSTMSPRWRATIEQGLGKGPRGFATAGNMLGIRHRLRVRPL